MMTIVRIDAEARWSDVVIHNNTLYYTGVPENLDADAQALLMPNSTSAAGNRQHAGAD